MEEGSNPPGQTRLDRRAISHRGELNHDRYTPMQGHTGRVPDTVCDGLRALLGCTRSNKWWIKRNAWPKPYPRLNLGPPHYGPPSQRPCTRTHNRAARPHPDVSRTPGSPQRRAGFRPSSKAPSSHSNGWSPPTPAPSEWWAPSASRSTLVRGDGGPFATSTANFLLGPRAPGTLKL